MSTARVIAWNTGVQIIGKIVSTTLGVIIIGMMTRYLGQDGFGIYSAASAYFQVFAIMLDLGLNIMLVQMLGEKQGDRDYEKRAVSATFTLRVVTAAILIGSAPFLGLIFYKNPLHQIVLFAIMGSFFFTALNQIVIGVQQRFLKMHIVAISEVAGRLVLLFGLLIARNMGWGLTRIVIFVSLGGFVNFAINTLVAKRYASFSWNWDVKFWRVLLRRSWPIGLSIIFNLLYFKSDTLILSWVRPYSEVGIYGAAYRVLEILVSLPFMYTGVVLPLLANSWATKNFHRFNLLLKHSYVAMAMLVAPMVAGSLVLGRQVMIMIAGSDFALSGDILKILIFAVAIIYFGTVSSHVIVALDAQLKMMPVYIATSVVTVVGYILFIPQYGMWAAAWLTVFSEACVALGATLISLKIAKTSLLWSPIFKSILAAVAMGLLIQPIKNLWLPIPILAGAVIYPILILATGALSKETLKELLAFRRGTPTADVT
ncbi:MAG: flippase [Patescibacteria group bacterium]